jgi:hypothetical protein
MYVMDAHFLSESIGDGKRHGGLRFTQVYYEAMKSSGYVWPKKSTRRAGRQRVEYGLPHDSFL